MGNEAQEIQYLFIHAVSNILQETIVRLKYINLVFCVKPYGKFLLKKQKKDSILFNRNIVQSSSPIIMKASVMQQLHNQAYLRELKVILPSLNMLIPKSRLTKYDCCVHISCCGQTKHPFHFNLAQSRILPLSNVSRTMCR